jgi:hypothetical protein
MSSARPDVPSSADRHGNWHGRGKARGDQSLLRKEKAMPTTLPHLNPVSEQKLNASSVGALAITKISVGRNRRRSARRRERSVHLTGNRTHWTNLRILRNEKLRRSLTCPMPKPCFLSAK